MFHPAVVQQRRTRAIERYREISKNPSFDLVERGISEVDSWNARLKDAFDSEGVQTRALAPDEETFVQSEMLLCQTSWRYWFDRYCYVTTDRDELSRVQLWNSQEEVIARLGQQELAQSSQDEVKLFLMILKARQLGISVVSESILAHQTFLFPRSRAILAADHEDTSKMRWNDVMTIYDNLVPWMKPQCSNREFGVYFRLGDFGSEIRVGAGNQKTTLGQGQTAKVIHLTEMSTWEFPDVIDADIMPAFTSSRAPVTVFLIESTGAGMGENWFYKQYQSARKGTSRFESVFIGWFMARDKYVASADGVTFTTDTLEMADRVARESGVSLSREQLAWYQQQRTHYEGMDRLDFFLQEYASNEEEAFQSGAKNVFGPALISRLRNRVKSPIGVYEVNLASRKLREVDSWDGKAEDRLILWETNRPGFSYVVGVDVGGTLTGDPSAILVNRVGNKRSGDELVAQWWGRIHPADLATICWLVGHVYTDQESGLPALMAIESNISSPGLLTSEELKKMGYLNFYINKRLDTLPGGGETRQIGWYTTPATRSWLVETGMNALKDGSWQINSREFIGEMTTFVKGTTPGGRIKPQAAPGSHDDLLLAGFISFYCSHEYDVEVLADERRRRQEAKVSKDRPATRPLHELCAEEGLTYEQALQLVADDFADRGLYVE